jgi:hypothetical protein
MEKSIIVIKKFIGRSLFVTVIFLLALVVNVQGAVINAGFETGDLTGWTTNLSGGTATVVNSHSTTYDPPATYLPAEGSYFLAIMSGNPNVWQTVSQSLTLSAGETIGGMAAFNWGDYPSFYDGAMVQVLGLTGAQIALPFFMDGSNLPSGYNGPWTTWSWTAPADGTYILQYAARNTIDAGGPDQTYGYFDAAQVQGIPEPTTLLLLSSSLLGLLGIRRTIRK